MKKENSSFLHKYNEILSNSVIVMTTFTSEYVCGYVIAATRKQTSEQNRMHEPGSCNLLPKAILLTIKISKTINSRLILTHAKKIQINAAHTKTTN